MNFIRIGQVYLEVYLKVWKTLDWVRMIYLKEGTLYLMQIDPRLFNVDKKWTLFESIKSTWKSTSKFEYIELNQNVFRIKGDRSNTHYAQIVYKRWTLFESIKCTRKSTSKFENTWTESECPTFIMQTLSLSYYCWLKKWTVFEPTKSTRKSRSKLWSHRMYLFDFSRNFGLWLIRE